MTIITAILTADDTDAAVVLYSDSSAEHSRLLESLWRLDSPSPLKPIDRLTERQRDVFLEIMKGKTGKDIARSLGLAVGTVKVHTQAVFRVFGVRSRMQLACAVGFAS